MFLSWNIEWKKIYWNTTVPIVWCVVGTGDYCPNTIWNSETALISFWLIKKRFFTKSSQKPWGQGGIMRFGEKRTWKKVSREGIGGKQKELLPFHFRLAEKPPRPRGQQAVGEFSGPEARKKKAKGEAVRSRHACRGCSWRDSQLTFPAWGAKRWHLESNQVVR